MQDYHNINPKDIRITTYGDGLNGFIQKPSDGIQVVHLPTGIVVRVDTERGQHKNRHLALLELDRQLEELNNEQE